MATNLKKEDADYCTKVVQQNALDLYLADLLLPDHIREDVIVLHAFHAEISGATLSYSEPVATQIRLQWWTEVLNGQRQEEAAGNPLARALLAVVGKHDLPRQSLTAKLDAHVFDLYNDPMADRTMLEGWCGETRSVLYHLAGLIAGAENDTVLADASGHAGVASGIVSLLNHLSWHHHTGRVFVPGEILTAHNLDATAFLSSPLQNHQAVILSMITLAREHFQKSWDATKQLPADHKNVFKPLALVPVYLDRIEKNPIALFTQPKSVSQLRKQWALWRF